MADNEKRLVAAAYRAAAEAVKNEAVEEVAKSDEAYNMAIAHSVQAIQSLTPADAEKALREFGLKVAEEVAKGVDYSWGERKPQLIKIVDEAMKG